MSCRNVIAGSPVRPGRLMVLVAGAAGILAGTALCVPAVIRAAAAPAAAVAQLEALTRTLRATGAGVIVREDPRAITQAFLEAETLARLDALGQFMAYVYAIETPSGTIGYLVEQDPAKKAVVDSYIQGARLLGTRFPAVDRIEVNFELNLNGLDALLEQ